MEVIAHIDPNLIIMPRCLIHDNGLLSDCDRKIPQNCQKWLQWTDKRTEYTESCHHTLFTATKNCGQKQPNVAWVSWNMTTTVFIHRQLTWDHFRLYQSLTRELEKHSLISVSLKLENSFKLIMHIKECTNIIIKIYKIVFSLYLTCQQEIQQWTRNTHLKANKTINVT
jgi:hypothetical protein